MLTIRPDHSKAFSAINCSVNVLMPCAILFLKVTYTYCNAIHFHTSRGVLHIPVVGLGIIFIIIAITYHYWFFREYKRNKKALNRLENASV